MLATLRLSSLFAPLPPRLRLGRIGRRALQCHLDLFPQVIRIAIDDLNQGVTRRKIFLYAGLLVAISAAKGVFLFLTRWIIIGISREIEFRSAQ